MACGDNDISAGTLMSQPTAPGHPVFSILGDRLQTSPRTISASSLGRATPVSAAASIGALVVSTMAKELAVRSSVTQAIPPSLRVTHRVMLETNTPVDPMTLQPNTVYEHNNNVHVTDEHGHTAWSRINAQYVKDAPRHKSFQREAGKVERQKNTNFVGGHIGAATLGGHGSGPNIVAQDSNLNVSAMASFENTFRDLVKSGNEVAYEIRITEDKPGDAIPSAFLLSYSVNGVDQGEWALLNEPHQLK